MLVLWIKEEVIQHTSDAADDTSASPDKQYFTGPKLMQLLGTVMKLKDDSSAVLADYDKTSSVLNFVLFLLMRGSTRVADKVRRNITGAWTKAILDQIEQQYLTPLARQASAQLEKCEPDLPGGAAAAGNGNGDAGEAAAADAEASVVSAAGQNGVEVEMTSVGASGASATRQSTMETRLQMQILQSTLHRVQEIIAEGRDEL